jgi:O-acetylhomoserine/O-acetylserine sulfhydrylase-like pyridoxal-dependent enzyme
MNCIDISAANLFTGEEYGRYGNPTQSVVEAKLAARWR